MCIRDRAAQSLGQNGQYIYYDQDMNNVSVYFSMGDQYTCLLYTSASEEPEKAQTMNMQTEETQTPEETKEEQQS